MGSENYKIKSLKEHLANDNKPKRILALDGGGLRGILSIAILEKIEKILKAQHGNNENFRLSHYFDLIAGTSTGAIIASALCLGWSVDEIKKTYFSLGDKVFKKSLLKYGFFRAKYDESNLIYELKNALGENTTLGSEKLETGLLIITKRLDSGSPWPISNNPKGKYFNTRPGGTIGNKDYLLWQVVRASTAAPTYFDSETITIAEKEGSPTLKGEFIDGGVSPFNNPALQAVMYSTLKGYNISWPMGEQDLQVVSIGSGRADPKVKKSEIAAKHGIQALSSIMDDVATLQESVLQWLSVSPTARVIDRELGDLKKDSFNKESQLTYLRYNVDLEKNEVIELDPSLINKDIIAGLSAMDAPENMNILYDLGKLGAVRDVHSPHFSDNFKLS